MAFRRVAPCHGCSHWRDEAGRVLAGTSVAAGECRRRVQPGTDGLRPRQPVTQSRAGCSESVPVPAPERLPENCGDCRYWAPLVGAKGTAADEGVCRVWAPRWSGTEQGHAFPVTTRGFYCGDGVGLRYTDPGDEDA